MPRVKSEGQTTIKVPKRMVGAMKEFLKTEEAKRLGLDSISDVGTEALREFFKKYGLVR
jgi:hypothetical protein